MNIKESLFISALCFTDESSDLSPIYGSNGKYSISSDSEERLSVPKLTEMFSDVWICQVLPFDGNVEIYAAVYGLCHISLCEIGDIDSYGKTETRFRKISPTSELFCRHLRGYHAVRFANDSFLVIRPNGQIVSVGKGDQPPLFDRDDTGMYYKSVLSLDRIMEYEEQAYGKMGKSLMSVMHCIEEQYLTAVQVTRNVKVAGYTIGDIDTSKRTICINSDVVEYERWQSWGYQKYRLCMYLASYLTYYATAMSDKKLTDSHEVPDASDMAEDGRIHAKNELSEALLTYLNSTCIQELPAVCDEISRLVQIACGNDGATNLFDLLHDLKPDRKSGRKRIYAKYAEGRCVDNRGVPIGRSW